MVMNAIARFRKLFKENADEIEVSGVAEKDFAKDLYVVTTMIDEGYALSDIMGALKKSLAGGRTQTIEGKAASLYVDKVMDRVNVQLTRNALSDFTVVRKELKRLIDADRLKYNRGRDDDAFFSTYRKGALLLALMIKDGYNSDTVEAVVRQGKDIPFKSDDELNDILDKCRRITEKYMDISATQLRSKAKDPKDIYMQYAKEYMQKTKSSMLNLRDEQKIVGTMQHELEELYRRKLPKATDAKTKAEIDSLIDRELKPFCRKALSEGSPVADEPGRDRLQYVEAVLNGADLFSARMRPEEERYQEIKNRFVEFRVALEHEMNERMRLPIGALMDADLAKKLINDDQDEKLLIKIIADSSNSAKDQMELADGDRERYARIVVASAKESLHREKNILYAEKKDIPHNVPFSVLEDEHHITASDLYILALQERMETYPSFRNHLSEEYADVDACVKLITRYKDINHAIIRDAVEECSPRQALPGIPEDYPDKVIQRAQIEVNQARREEEKYQNLQVAFNKSRGFADEGIHDNIPMNDYKDCKVAVQMLLRNVPEDDIRQFITKIAPKNDDIPPMRYAAAVMASAKAVVVRARQAEDYRSDEGNYGRVDRLYMEAAHELLNPKDFPDTAMDIQIFQMLKLKDVPEDEIKQSIMDHSPSAIEYGRTKESYADFVQNSANHQIEEEIKKLNNYICMPREEHEESAAEEYTHHLKKIQDYINLPFNPTMDKKIARALIQQDFSEQDVAESINRNSPLKKMKGAGFADYGASIVRSIVKDLKISSKNTEKREPENISHNMEEIHVRQRIFKSEEEYEE